MRSLLSAAVPAALLSALAFAACSDDSSDSDGMNGGSGGSSTAGSAGSSNAAGNGGSAGSGMAGSDMGTGGTMMANAGSGGSAGSGMAGSGMGDDATAMSMFVTSQNNTGNLGGLEGADGICQTLAEAVGSTKTWRAYLSVSDGGDGQPVNARDRIGSGPWYNADGVEVAADVDALHALAAGDVDLFLDEAGEPINGQWEDSPDPVEHDIMTGSDADGNLMAGETCDDWTSDSADPGPRVGHSDGLGPGGNGDAPFNSWNSSHTAPNCSEAGLNMVGGAGKIYCFATD